MTKARDTLAEIELMTQLCDVLHYGGPTDRAADGEFHPIKVLRTRWSQSLTPRELAAVLCGLRCLQAFWLKDHEPDMKALASILTDGWTLAPVTSAEIDQLCERLNTRPQ